MGLSRDERRRLASLEEQLRAADPHFTEMIDEWPTGPRWRAGRRRRGWLAALCALGATALLAAGAALSPAAAPALLVGLGVAAGAGAIAAARSARGPKPARRRARSRRGRPGPESRLAWPVAGVGWLGWWW